MTTLRLKARSALARAWTRKPGEIWRDELAAALSRIAAEPAVRSVLEIGSATGDGSTRALVEGARTREEPPLLVCLEADPARFAELRDRYAAEAFVEPRNAFSVGRDGYASEAEIAGFYAAIPSALNAFPLEVVLGWRRAELALLEETGLPDDGVARALAERGPFDAVVVDGSEFTARAEVELVHGAGWLVLDDVNSFKNHFTCQRLLADPAYRLVEADPKLRNGYAVFRRAG